MVMPGSKSGQTSPRRVLVLYSGGLDSTLAVGLMHQAGLEVIPLVFETPFTNPLSKEGKRDKAGALQEAFGLSLQKVWLGDELLELVKSPKFGRGKHINCCIDCHLLMLQRARELMLKLGADFIATGEVLGQRPMSQHRQALELIVRKSQLEGLVLRPLSARHLDRTLPETEGWVKREFLLDITGRSRKRQLDLAREWGLSNFHAPAGGCLLTEAGYSRKMRVLLDADMLTVANCQWIQYGRFFDLDPECKLVVARNEQECELLEKLAGDEDLLIWPQNISGPTALLRGGDKEKVMKKALSIVSYYCRSQEATVFELKTHQKERSFPQPIPPMSKEELLTMLIS